MSNRTSVGQIKELRASQQLSQCSECRRHRVVINAQSQRCVNRMSCRASIAAREHEHVKDARNKAILTARSMGQSYGQIAAAFNVTRQRVYQICKRG